MHSVLHLLDSLDRFAYKHVSVRCIALSSFLFLVQISNHFLHCTEYFLLEFVHPLGCFIDANDASVFPVISTFKTLGAHIFVALHAEQR